MIEQEHRIALDLNDLYDHDRWHFNELIRLPSFMIYDRLYTYNWTY